MIETFIVVGALISYCWFQKFVLTHILSDELLEDWSEDWILTHKAISHLTEQDSLR